MKILVFGQPLDVGGTQVNGIELAAALRDTYGHEVIYFATPGPMLKLVEQKGLRFVAAPAAVFHPSFARMRALYELIVCERPDLIHVWDWNQCLDAYYVAHLGMSIPMVVTDMMMKLHRLLPKSLPTTFGFPELFQQARAAGRRRLEIIVPHVDVQANAPGSVDAQPFRDAFEIKAGEITLVTVSRLASWMKAESLRRSIDAVRVLGREFPLRLIIVGDGDARGELEMLAYNVNTELRRKAVVLAGAMHDPRPAYAAADVVIGMGSSALRGMAFAKPVIVVGECGFCAPLTAQTAEYFYHNGLYGLGDNAADNSRLIAQILWLVQCPEQFAALGAFSRGFVLKHFTLELVCERLERFLRAASAEMPQFHVAAWDGFRTAAVWLKERRFLPGGWRQEFTRWLSRRAGVLAFKRLGVE